MAVYILILLDIFDKVYCGEEAMIRTAAALVLVLLLPAAHTAEEKCKCKKYPFEPNPPCFKVCTTKLYTGEIRSDSVLSLDRQVSANIERLRQRDVPVSELADVNNESDLEMVLRRHESFKKDLEQ